MKSLFKRNRLLVLSILLIGALVLVGCSNSDNDSVTPDPYTVSGQIVDVDGNGVEGVTLNFSNIDATAITDEEGNWTKTDLTGQVTITPVKEGFVFNPNNKTVDNAQDDIVFEIREEDSVYEVVFLHTNDEHGVLENFGKIAWQKQQFEKEYDDVFLVSGGDMFSGTPIVDEYVINEENLRGKPMTELMNMAAYDAVVIGNHEFDYGQQRVQDSIDSTDYPWILANIEVDENVATMTQPDPYVILETSFGAEVALLGLVQVSSSTGYPSTLIDNLYGLNFPDPVDTALNYTYLREQSDIFVGLTHMGHGWEQSLAEEMGELDLIIGGHSHTVVDPPAEVNDVLIAQAGDDTRYLGKIVVTVDAATHEVIGRRGELIDTATIKGTIDEVEDKIAYFEGQVEDIFNREINYLETSISGREALGSLMTDAITESTIVASAYDDNIDFAFQNGGGIRVGSLDAGPLTVGEIFELEPFGNHVIVFEMTAEDIRSLVEFSYNRRGSIDLRVSGLHYEVKINQLGAGVGANLYDYDGNELGEDKVYNVALTQYVATAYEYTSQNDGVDTYIRANDAIISFLENDISREELNTRYEDVNRVSTVIVEGTDGGTEIAETTVPLTTEGSRDGSVSAGNLFADAAREELGVDIGIYPADQFVDNSTIDSGTIYKEALGPLLYDSFRFDNNVVIATLDGENLEEMILNQADSNFPSVTQISGAEYTVITNSYDTAHEIKVYINGERVKADGEYTIAINDFRWNHYSNGVEVIKFETSERTEEEILVDYLKNVQMVGEGLEEDRITIEVDKNLDPQDEIATTEVDITTVGMQEGSITAGNLLMDAFVTQIEEAEIALYSLGDLEEGATIEAGPIYEELLDNIAFEYTNNVTVVALTADEIRNIIQTRYESNHDGPNQVSGMKYTINNDGEVTLDIDVEKDYYNVALNSFIWDRAGWGGYAGIVDRDDVEVIVEETSRTEREILIDHLKELGTVTDEVEEERITIQ
ncbi:5'-nucleotidase C-terminal domain-containing protein [Halonatronum saccharophilum]|uniref:5'-nucleotidase C-terminal domain-containing protein n=1 Tax=Halonatronum saccharophilum TaxID=150060 RepID=UPI000480E13C|nr:5'-nucleotidase C-terminal domain-containing protein [Halonatronum saccharophilum]